MECSANARTVRIIDFILISFYLCMMFRRLIKWFSDHERSLASMRMDHCFVSTSSKDSEWRKRCNTNRFLCFPSCFRLQCPSHSLQSLHCSPNPLQFAKMISHCLHFLARFLPMTLLTFQPVHILLGCQCSYWWHWDQWNQYYFLQKRWYYSCLVSKHLKYGSRLVGLIRLDFDL